MRLRKLGISSNPRQLLEDSMDTNINQSREAVYLTIGGVTGYNLLVYI